MTNKSLVLVLGAGSSKEVGLPIGTELKATISDLLNFVYDADGALLSGDAEILQSVLSFSQGNEPSGFKASEFPDACRNICRAMPLAISIDNYIDSQSSSQAIPACAKLAIVKAILSAENKSRLALKRRAFASPAMDFLQSEDSWFNVFFKLLTQNCQIDNLPDRLQKVGIITFNYDRCFEHFMFHALQSYYVIDEHKARMLMQCLDIFHPYGSVGKLPWTKTELTQEQNSAGTCPQEFINFGGVVTPKNLHTLATGINTFSEGTNSEELHELRDMLRLSDRVAFLGFAFHELNLDLLFCDNAGTKLGLQVNQKIYGSALGISTSDTERVLDSLRPIAGKFHQPVELRNDLTCAALLREYSRSLAIST
jgi:hypothetical protein